MSLIAGRQEVGNTNPARRGEASVLSREKLFHFMAGVFEDGPAVAEEQHVEVEGQEPSQGLFQLGRVVEFVFGDEPQAAGRMTVHRGAAGSPLDVPALQLRGGTMRYPALRRSAVTTEQTQAKACGYGIGISERMCFHRVSHEDKGRHI